MVGETSALPVVAHAGLGADTIVLSPKAVSAFSPLLFLGSLFLGWWLVFIIISIIIIVVIPLLLSANELTVDHFASESSLDHPLLAGPFGRQGSFRNEAQN